MSGTAETNKEVVRRHFDALNSRDYGDLANIHHSDGRNHAKAAFDLSEWPSEGVPFGPEEVRGTFEWLTAGFPDLRVGVLDLVGEADKVVARIRMTGTHEGEFVGLAPTGARWDFEHVHIFRLADGRIAEHWAVREDLKAMLQLGVLAPPVPPGRQYG